MWHEDNVQTGTANKFPTNFTANENVPVESKADKVLTQLNPDRSDRWLLL